MKDILIVEDSVLAADYLKTILEEEGYSVLDIVDKGQKAIEVAKHNKPKIILMDMMLKDQISGAEAAIEIYHHVPQCKIIFLTAYSDDEMIEYINRSGAYAYMLKPYRKKEILVTIKLALLQNQNNMISASTTVPLGNGYYFDTEFARLCQADREVALSRNAHKLIEILVKNRNHIVSKEQIAFHIWHELKSDNTLRSLLHRVQDKLGINLIHNVKGRGYVIYNSHYQEYK